MKGLGCWIHRTLFFSLFVGCRMRDLTSDEMDESERPVTLNDIMPKNYDSVRPPKYKGKAATVLVRIYLLNIRALDDSEMTFTTDIFMQQFWEDWRLTFPDWVKGSRVVINVKWFDNIWLPDLYFQNAIDSKVEKLIVPNLYMWMYRNNSIHLYGRYTLKSSCDMNLHRFPHDTQTCQLKILSLTYSQEEMKMQWTTGDGFLLSQNIVLPQFQMLNLSCSESVLPLQFGNVSSLTAEMQFKRREGYYIINVYVPTVLIVMMSMLTFWIPPDAVPARVTLGVTSLLTMITKQYQSEMPNVSYIVALNVWLSCCIGFVFCSLLEYAVVIALVTKFRKKDEEAKNFPERIRHDGKGKIRTMYSEGVWRTAVTCKKNNFAISKTPHLIDHFSRILFPLTFIIISVVYWNNYTRY